MTKYIALKLIAFFFDTKYEQKFSKFGTHEILSGDQRLGTQLKELKLFTLKIFL